MIIADDKRHDFERRYLDVGVLHRSNVARRVDRMNIVCPSFRNIAKSLACFFHLVSSSPWLIDTHETRTFCLTYCDVCFPSRRENLVSQLLFCFTPGTSGNNVRDKTSHSVVFDTNLTNSQFAKQLQRADEGWRTENKFHDLFWLEKTSLQINVPEWKFYAKISVFDF